MLEGLHRFGVRRSTTRGVAKVAHWAGWVGFLTLLVCTSPSAKRHRVRCVARFWGWQLWRRVMRRPIQVLLPQGWQLEFPPWSELAGITAATGLHEPAEELFALAYLRSGDSVVDVGANLGIYTVACASIGARVSAFEPSSLARDALDRNISLNGLSDLIRVFPMALGEENASVSLTTHLDVGNHLVTPGEGSASDETVPVRTLDSMVDQDPDWFSAGRMVLLKIDVEGHDAAVLRGAGRTLADDRPVVLVETWDGGAEIRAFLARLGYRVYRYDIGAQALVEYPATWAGQANFIAVPDKDLAGVRQRLTDAGPPILAPPRVRWRISAE